MDFRIVDAEKNEKKTVRNRPPARRTGARTQFELQNLDSGGVESSLDAACLAALFSTIWP